MKHMGFSHVTLLHPPGLSHIKGPGTLVVTLRSVSMGLTVNRQTAKNFTVKLQKRGNVTVNRQKQNRFNWYNQYPCFQIYSLYGIFHSFDITLQLPSTWKSFRFQNCLMINCIYKNKKVNINCNSWQKFSFDNRLPSKAVKCNHQPSKSAKCNRQPSKLHLD